MYAIARSVNALARITLALTQLNKMNKNFINAATISAASASTNPNSVFNKRNLSDKQQPGNDQQETCKQQSKEDFVEGKMENKTEKLIVNKDDLKKRLTPLQYQVTQEAATERPFTGVYNKHYEKGVYQCIVCHQDLFSSDTKYDSGCGWPAFNDVLDKGKITLHRDASIPGGNLLVLIAHPERIRTEVRCARCNAHMGHVFEDGPKPTRKRYCINSAAIEFISADELNQRASANAPTATTGSSVFNTAQPITTQQ